MTVVSAKDVAAYFKCSNRSAAMLCAKWRRRVPGHRKSIDESAKLSTGGQVRWVGRSASGRPALRISVRFFISRCIIMSGTRNHHSRDRHVRLAAVAGGAASAAGIRGGGRRRLVAAHVAEHSEAAFAALVDRYGRLVWHWCRRILGPGPDAEDAFQATFVVMSRRAASIRPDAVAGWLHAVSRRVALRALARRAKRQSAEMAASQNRNQSIARNSTEPTASDLLAASTKKSRDCPSTTARH